MNKKYEINGSMYWWRIGAVIFLSNLLMYYLIFKLETL